MNLYTWYMQQAEKWAEEAEYRREMWFVRTSLITFAQDRCATYVTLANQAAERYGA